MHQPADVARPFRAHLEPGQRVRMADRPDWGVGWVQSAIGERVTIGFEQAGKMTVNARLVRLEICDD